MQKSIFPFVIISFLYLNRLFSQGFYDIEQIQEIKLTFSQTNWDAQLDQLKATDEEAYLLAASVEVNGIVFDSVGVKYKGNSSYNANNQKNPMHIELNYVHKNADYDGFSDIKLGNGFSDPSFVREPLSYEIVGKYMVAPRANYAKLWINGVYWGVYSNQESINKQLVKAHLYTDGDNPLFKCNPVGGAGPGSSGGNPDLVYSSADSTAYYSKYELKSDYGWAQMLTLMSTLKNNPAQIESILDVDRALWMIALNNVLVNLDSYTGSFAQNYYLYQDENDRFIPIIWDLNMCFGGFPMLGSGGGGGGALSVTQMQQMDAAVQSTNASRPLIQKLLANPVYKRQYLAHIRTILAENFATTAYKTRALELQALISQAVQDDTKKFYTFANFTSNIDNTVSTGGGGGGFGNVPGITLLMNARNTFLNSTALLSPLAPTITEVAPSTATPVPGQEVWITAKITDASTVTLGHRSQFWAVFEKTPMFDDGAHQDGAAGDGIWGAALIADNVENQYYIYAENANAGRFSPERAEYEFHSFGTSLPAPASGQVVINEFLTNNQNGATDEFGQKEDWLEIYNRTGNAFDLAGLQLTDKASTPNKFIFPRGSVILPNGYLMVWLDEDGGQGLTHANFKLSNNGEFLMLSDSNGVVYDSLSFGAQTADISYGRYPNGTGIFQTMPTTFAKENSLVSAVNELYSKAKFNLYPNPAGDFIQVQSSQNIGNMVVQNALGQALIQINADGQQRVQIPLIGIAPGMYWVRVQGAGVRAFVVMR